jgi:spore coat polysaccharide biosynthesis protein SpsF (cytidylyltransferase family)
MNDAPASAVHAILVCRMGSSRLPGKTLGDFGGRSLLAHIVGRIASGGIAPARIVVCSSTEPEDDPIEVEAAALGCAMHRGPASDVSGRVLGAAEAYGLDGFLFMLGDNPWLDPATIADTAARGAGGGHDYLVTATGELPRARWPERMWPIGTRVQWIDRAFMAARLAASRSAETEEHSSRLFADMPPGTRSEILVPADGRPADEVGKLNISINTAADRDRARAVLAQVGADAPIAAVTAAYLEGTA